MEFLLVACKKTVMSEVDITVFSLTLKRVLFLNGAVLFMDRD